MSRAKTWGGQGGDSGYYAQFFSLFLKKHSNTFNDLAASRVFFLLFNPNWWFLKTCDMFLEWKDKSLTLLGVYISVMLHQNSFRVDTVLDGCGIEDSVEKMASFPLTRTSRPNDRLNTLSAAPGRSFTAGVGEDRKKNDDWTTGGIKMFDSVTHLAPIVDYDHVYDSDFSLRRNENWWFNS